MATTEIISKLEQIFNEVFTNDTVVLTETLTANDVGGWDSLSHMLLISEVEQGFGIKFKLSDLNKMRNVGDMVNIISSKLNA